MIKSRKEYLDKLSRQIGEIKERKASIVQDPGTPEALLIRDAMVVTAELVKANLESSMRLEESSRRIEWLTLAALISILITLVITILL